MDTHRISLELRSGIWLLFSETLISPYSRLYKQELLRIFGHRIKADARFTAAEKAALFVIRDRKINSPLIVRDNSERNVILRGE